VARIGEMLLQRGACTEEGLRAALETQVIFGGRLGTNLLETGGVTVEALAAALGAKHGVPHLSGDVEVDRSALMLVPVETADRCNVVPFVLSGRKLGVLCADPTELAALDEVAFVSGKNVEPIVVPEARLWMLLNRLYRTDRHLRAISLSGEASAARPPRPRPELPPGTPRPIAGWDAARGELVEMAELEGRLGTDEEEAPGGAPTAVEPAPRPGTLSGLELPPLTLDLLARMVHEGEERAHGRPPPPPLTPVPRHLPPEPDPIELRVALPAIQAARDREAIAAVVLRHARSRFRRAALFVIHGGQARGWVASVPGVGSDGIHALAMPVEAPGLVAGAVSRGEVWQGPLLHCESDVRLVAALGGGAPSRAVAVPISTLGKVVNVLYADCGPGGWLVPEAVDELAAVAGTASRRYEVLLGR
jgi:hypothetical protein